MLYINLFPDGDALLDTVPQGEASIPLNLPDGTVEALSALLTCDRMSADLARLSLARMFGDSRGNTAICPKPGDWGAEPERGNRRAGKTSGRA